MTATLLVKKIQYNFSNFLELIRFYKPTGTLLLFFPCAFSVSIVAPENYLTYLGVFLFGSFLMRSSGCIINDLADKDFDKYVERTKKRPLAAGSISVKMAIFYLIIMLTASFLLLIQFNFLTIILGFIALGPVFLYPFMKRLTYYPQIFLGFTFNAGALLSYASIENTLTFEIILIYFSCVLWTIHYDTIYALQDIKDDLRIGVKSTAIKFADNANLILIIVAVFHCIILNYALNLLFTNILLNIACCCLQLAIFTILHIQSFYYKRPGWSFHSCNIYGALLTILIYYRDFLL